MSAHGCKKKKKKMRSPANQEHQTTRLTFGRGAVTKAEGGLGPRAASNSSLQPLFPTGDQASLRFRVPSQSYQATTESPANPGTGSGLRGEIRTTPATAGLTPSERR